MPCFKGLAVSIHTPDGPLPEHSVQRQSRASRIACFIPVPPAKLSKESNKSEQSTFAISITLLNPGQSVPYSTPKPTPETPIPKPKIVGSLSNSGSERGSGVVGPYQPLTNSPNETIAAYIYFDGRQKEEVATLLRRGEETWVNSRWVSVPESEGGGLAEREFLFREVGLERWLNGLDLEGHDAAAKIERRRQKIEKRRLKKQSISEPSPADVEMASSCSAPNKRDKGIMRYGADSKSPLENLSEDDDDLSSLTDSDDDPIPESAGQIKVALFRVLASGEIKRGEYSPQFDAHDDDEDSENGGRGNGDADVDHTTSFAKPKTLDPKTISTQTVTGIDPTDRPYAIFTFMYRGERQLQKMGILKSKTTEKEETNRRKSQPDFSKLGPLKPGGAVGFMNFREGDQSANTGRRKSKGDGHGSDMDSEDDDDDEPVVAAAEVEEATKDGNSLSPDDIRRQGELAEGVRKIKLKRQHSADQIADQGSLSNSGTPASGSTPANGRLSTTPPHTGSAAAAATAASTSHPLSTTTAAEPQSSASIDSLDGAFIGSPLKKPRAASTTLDEETLRRRMGSGLSTDITKVLGSGDHSPGANLTSSDSGGGISTMGSHFGGSLNTLGNQPSPATNTADDDYDEL